MISLLKNFLVEKGFDQKFGASPLRRAIQKYVEDPIAEEILRNTFKDGSKIVAKHVDNMEELIFLNDNLEIKLPDEEQEQSGKGENKP